MHTKTLSSNMEDYLEAIYQIVLEKQAARAKDISDRLGVSGSSVTGALQALAKRRLVNYAPYDIVTLTSAGEDLGRKISRRHEVLRGFFVDVLGVDGKSAGESACRMEHAVSEPILTRLEQFIEFLEHCPRAGFRWSDEFGSFCFREGAAQEYADCVAECLRETEKKVSANG